MSTFVIYIYIYIHKYTAINQENNKFFILGKPRTSEILKWQIFQKKGEDEDYNED